MFRRVVGAKPRGTERGEISGEQSPKSRRRAAFAFGNAAVDLQWMATLTWPGSHHVDGPTAKTALKRLQEWLRRRDILAGWILEFHRSGQPHFHLFLPGLPDFPTRTVTRCGQATRVDCCQGWALEFVSAWMRSIGSDDWRFNKGGILERLRLPGAAGRYVAKEACKRAQKRAPDGWGWVGRWWGIPRGWKPRPIRSYEIPDDAAPPYSIVWDKGKLPPPRPTPNLRHNRSKVTGQNRLNPAGVTTSELT